MNLKDEKGFTLVELLVGMVIMVVVIGGMFTVIASYSKAQTYTKAKGSNILDATRAVDRISEELQYAYSSSVSIKNVTTNEIQSSSTNNAIVTATTYGLASPVTTHELFFTRHVFQNSSEIGNSGKESRHIYLKNNKVYMDYGVYPQNDLKNWVFNTSGPKTVQLTSGSIQNLTFIIDQINDSDVSSPGQPNDNVKRKRITITAVADGDGVSNSTAGHVDANDHRIVTFTTQVITNNLN